MLRNFGGGPHSRVAVRVPATNVQVANSRLFELRNAGANLIVIKSLLLRALQIAAGTAQENSLDLYKVTGFSAVDTTNTATPVPSLLRPAPTFVSTAALRACSGHANGMTGGTLTKETTPIASLPFNVATAINITSQFEKECFADLAGGGEPLVLAANEGLIVESRVLNVTSYGMAFFIDMTWQESGAPAA